MSLTGALAGTRVLDFTRVLAGPLCTMLLADLGAEVLKIERPGAGDDTRAWGPPFAGSESAYFLCLNRGKHSLELDLSGAAGRARARELALQADVVVENFRAGWMAAQGLGGDALRSEHPGLIYCSVTGYGQDGPDRDLPGYDFLAQGRAGLMSITGEADGPPLKVGVAVSDLTSGLFAAVGILAALQKRTLTGEGSSVDVALLDCQVAGLLNVASNALVSGRVPGRYGNAHPNIVPYQVFEAADGPIILAVGNDAQWRRCCPLLGHPEWADDPRFATNPARVAARETLAPRIAAVLRTRPVAEWLAAFAAAHVPAGPIQDIGAVFQDPQVLARGMVQEVAHPAAGLLRLIANPLLRHATTGRPPLLGEGGEDLAAQWCASPRSDGERR